MTDRRTSRAKLLAYCLAKPGAWPDEPWHEDVVVKVGAKIFAFLGAEEGHTIGLKCGRDRDDAEPWRARFPGDVTVSAYIGRYGWNTFAIDGAVPEEDLLEAIDASYVDVVARLPVAQRP
ncbi:MAG: MmcQ/YjbR family DNA-binding protein [bacterium]